MHIQKKLEENKFRRMLEALKGVEVRRIDYTDDPSVDSWREIYRQYVTAERWETSDCLKIPDSSTWEQICAVLSENGILYTGQTVLFVVLWGGVMAAELLIQDVPSALHSLWYHEVFLTGGAYSPGFMLIDTQRNVLFDVYSDSADEENYRVDTWRFNDNIG